MASRSGVPKMSRATLAKAQAVLNPPKRPKPAPGFKVPQAPLKKKGGVPQLRKGALTGGSFNALHPRRADGKFRSK